MSKKWNWPETTTQTTSFDELSQRIDSVDKELKQLKLDLSRISVDEKNRKISEIKNLYQNCLQDLEWLEKDNTAKVSKESLNWLKMRMNWLKSQQEILEKQIVDETNQELSRLQESTKDNWWWNTKTWFGDQWKWLTSKDEWKNETWKNILRAVGWIWLVWWAIWLWKKIFGKKKNKINYAEEIEWYEDMTKKEKRAARKKLRKEKREEERWDEPTFWEKPAWKFLKRTGAVLWVWSVVYYLAHGLYTKNWGIKDLFDWEKGKKLEFDAALEYCKWAIANQDNKEGMSYGMNLKYHEDTWEIEAYWERVKIDKDKRKILWTWLGDVTFKKYEHMINTAILIAYLKKNYSWKCVNDTPFHLTWDWQGDLNVNTASGDAEAVDWTWNWWRIVWITAGWIAWILTWIFGWLKAWVAVTTIWWAGWYMLGSAYDHNNIMNDHMPELDNEFWKKSLWAYLNSMACRKTRNQTTEDITESPIKPEVVECMQEIQDTNKELEERWWYRRLDAIPDPNDEKKYTIKAYGRNFSAEVTWNAWNKEIRILWISGWNPEIKTDMSKWNMLNLKLPLKEWLYMSSLLWFFLENFHHKWNSYPRFEYTSRQFVIRTGAKYGIYFSDNWMDTYALTAEKFMENMPTLFKEKKRFLEFLNDWITDESNISIWKESK